MRPAALIINPATHVKPSWEIRRARGLRRTAQNSCSAASMLAPPSAFGGQSGTRGITTELSVQDLSSPRLTHDTVRSTGQA